VDICAWKTKDKRHLQKEKHDYLQKTYKWTKTKQITRTLLWIRQKNEGALGSCKHCALCGCHWTWSKSMVSTASHIQAKMQLSRWFKTWHVQAMIFMWRLTWYAINSCWPNSKQISQEIDIVTRYFSIDRFLCFHFRCFPSESPPGVRQSTLPPQAQCSLALLVHPTACYGWVIAALLIAVFSLLRNWRQIVFQLWWDQFYDNSLFLGITCRSLCFVLFFFVLSLLLLFLLLL